MHRNRAVLRLVLCRSLLVASILTTGTIIVQAQTTPDRTTYARRNTFGILTAYSPDSSHILLGVAERRKLLSIGVSYSRRIILNRTMNWQYDAELLPVALESDPLSVEIVTQTQPTAATVVYSGGAPVSCATLTGSYSFIDQNGVTHSGTSTFYCHGRQWTIGEGMSPVGMQWNFLPTHKIQPIFEGHGGYMYSTRPIPVATAGSFNFTFDFGAGLELYRTRSQSIRVGYRYHHLSNHNTANFNPGVDNGMIQVSYCFGR